ncbi:MAG: hypothetical protein PHT58_00295 [Eubacteriales bacterium]|nr:hypothetical protein [Eubacteriales bacterium]
MSKTKKVFRVLALIFANICLVLGAVFILFTILDNYNPLLHFLSPDFLLTKYIKEIIILSSMALGICTLVACWKKK